MQSPNSLNRVAGLLAAASLFGTPAAFAADASWNLNANGDWVTDGNWNPATAPGAIGTTTNTDTATFSSSVITAQRTVTVDNGRNIQNIAIDVDGFSGAYQPYTIGGSGNSLLLTSGGTLGTTGATNRTDASGTFTTAAVTTSSLVLQGNYTFSANTTTAAGRFGQFFIGGAATVSGATGLGNVTLTLTGQSVLDTSTGFGDQITGTAGGVFNGSITDGTGNTLSVVKEGTGAWQFNATNTYSGGTTIREGTIVVGNSSAGLGSGGVTLGESASALNAALTLNSGRNVASSMTVNSGSGLRTLGTNAQSSNATYSGAITLNDGAQLRLQKASSQSLVISGGITGTGNVEVYNNANTGVGPAAGIIFSTIAINNVGTVTNASPGTGTLTQTAGGILGSNVTEFIQNSATTTTTFSLANTYGSTTILAGTLATVGTGTLGTGDVIVNGGLLDLGSSISLSDTAMLAFISSVTPTIFLNNEFTDVVDRVYNITTSTYMDAGVWGASDLNTFFGTDAFSGLGTLTVVTAVPEPSTYALGILGLLAIVAFARRRKQTV